MSTDPVIVGAEAVVTALAQQGCGPSLVPEARVREVIQRLWGGYGALCRVDVRVRQLHTLQGSPDTSAETATVSSPGKDAPPLSPADIPPVIVCKYIMPPADSGQLTSPAPKALSVGDARKRRSYAVEAGFYHRVAPRLCAAGAPVAHVFAMDVRGVSSDSQAACIGCVMERRADAQAAPAPPPSFVVMSDLCFDGFTDSRPPASDVEAARGALRWLARLHGTFMADVGVALGGNGNSGVDDDSHHRRASAALALGGLWPQAQYFHLGTRAEELARLPQGCTLRRQAAAWDAQLRAAPQTICHGDAKLPNFLFRPSDRDDDDDDDDDHHHHHHKAGGGGRAAAGVDFQYSGLGCGMSDVAYLLHSTVGKAYPAAHRGDEYPPARFCRPGDAAAEAAEYRGWRAKVDPLLEGYLADLAKALSGGASDDRSEMDAGAITSAYRGLFEVAYLDYWRFYMGWFAPLRPPADASTDADVMGVAPGFVRHMLAMHAAGSEL